MGINPPLLKISEIKKYQNRVLLVLKRIILVFSFIGFGGFVLGLFIDIAKDSGADLLQIYFAIIIISFGVTLISLKDIIDRRRRDQEKIKEQFKQGESDLNELKYKDVTEYKYFFSRKLDEVIVIINQTKKTINSLKNENLKRPQDLDFYHEKSNEFIVYESDLKGFLNKNHIPMRFIMLNNSDIDDFFGNRSNNFQETKELVYEYNRIIRTHSINPNNLLSELTKLRSEIKQKTKIFDHWNDMIEILLKSKEGIQVSLNRIAELGNLNINITEIVLKLILENNPEIGMYYEYERTFIRGIESDETIISLKMKAASNSRDRTVESLQQCEKCEEFQSLLVRQCSKCGVELISCQICKRGYRKDERKTPCIHCDNSFHSNHLIEIVKVSGKCPICNKKLTLEQIRN